jgi:hypothetical protein
MSVAQAERTPTKYAIRIYVIEPRHHIHRNHSYGSISRI